MHDRSQRRRSLILVLVFRVSDGIGNGAAAQRKADGRCQRGIRRVWPTSLAGSSLAGYRRFVRRSSRYATLCVLGRITRSALALCCNGLCAVRCAVPVGAVPLPSCEGSSASSSSSSSSSSSWGAYAAAHTSQYLFVSATDRSCVLALALDVALSPITIIGDHRAAIHTGAAIVSEPFQPYGLAVWHDILLIADCKERACTLLALDTSCPVADWNHPEALQMLVHDPEDHEGRPRVCDLTVVGDTLVACGLSQGGSICLFTIGYDDDAPTSATAGTHDGVGLAVSSPPPSSRRVKWTSCRGVDSPTATYPDRPYFRCPVLIAALPPSRLLMTDGFGDSIHQHIASTLLADDKATEPTVPDSSVVRPDLCSRWSTWAMAPVGPDRLVMLNGPTEKEKNDSSAGGLCNGTASIVDFTPVVGTGTGVAVAGAPRVLTTLVLGDAWKQIGRIHVLDDLLIGIAHDQLLVVQLPDH